jgi:hypothetical protein
MRRIVCHCVTAILLCLFSSIVYAAPTVYPVKEVFGFDDADLVQKAPAFDRWSKSRGTKSFASEFDAAFRKEFGTSAAENITDVNKHEVLVASLHLIRASEYKVPKLGNYEVHMPLTLSIAITNPATGDVIYSFTKTSYGTVLLSGEGSDSQGLSVKLEKNATNYAFLLQTLIKEAKQGYNPTKIDISVVKTWNGLCVLDKGSKFGIARDDNLVDSSDNEISVKYVAEDYAIAAPLLGKAETGQKFYKFGTASTENQFNKPRVMTLHEGWDDYDLENISRLFDSELSKESAFTLLPVNEYFRKLLETVAMDTYAGKFETTQQRAIPDYMMKFTSSVPRVYAMNEKGKFSINVYEQYILGELLDKQGRIIFSAVGSDRIEDKNVGGMVFDREARLEVVRKNAVVNLAEQFAKSIKFSHQVHPVKNVSGNAIDLDDMTRDLRLGQDAVIYREIGRVDGIKSKIIVPIWQASVVEAENGKVKLDLVLPLAGKGIGVSDSDMVIVDAITSGATADQSETALTYCSGISPKLGSMDISDFPVISRVAGYRLHYTLYDNETQFSAKIHDALGKGGFKDTLKLGKVNTAGRCLQPVHKAAMEKNRCEGGVCTHEVSLVAGYRLYTGKDVKGKIASSTNIKTEDCLQDCQIPVIQGDLSKNALGIFKDTIGKLRYQ